jgi:16S rRNA (guanine527-N7)-methyltransferase
MTTPSPGESRPGEPSPVVAERPVDPEPLGLPAPPPDVAVVFDTPEKRRAITAYADILADRGVAHGLLGPREVPRIWSRHILNCAAIASLPARGAYLMDVGSGAGLPGLVLAIARPDLRVTLVEPLLRRVSFLDAAIEDLGVENVDVVRRRAEDWARETPELADIAVARAVAPLARLAGWCLPLVRPHGEMLAIKGESAAAELANAVPVLRKLGAVEWSVAKVGDAASETSATVVRIHAGGRGAGGERPRSNRSGRARRRSRSTPR